MSKTVSVVIPTRDRIDSLILAVRSALDQDLQPLEVIVVNDNPACQMVESRLADEFDSRVRYLQGTGQGAGPARNLGVQQSTGDYVAFLDDDDLWLPSKLRLQSERLSGKPDELCYTRVSVRHPGWEESRPKRFKAESESISSYLFQEGGLILPSSWMLSRSLAEKILFPAGLHEDWIVALELERRGCRFLGVPDVCTVWNQNRPRARGRTCLPSARRLAQAASTSVRPAIILDYVVPALLARGRAFEAFSELFRGARARTQQFTQLFRNRKRRYASKPIQKIAVFGLDTQLESELNGFSTVGLGVRLYDSPKSFREVAATLWRLRTELCNLRPQIVISVGGFSHLLQMLLCIFTGARWKRVFLQPTLRVDPRLESLLSVGICHDDLWVLPDAQSATQFRYHWLLAPAQVCERANWMDMIKPVGRPKDRLLYLTRDFPLPQDTGAKIRTVGLLEQLKEDFELTVICAEIVGADQLRNCGKICHQLLLPFSLQQQRTWWSRFLPNEIVFFTRSAVDEILWREAQSEEYDLLVYDHLHVSLHGWGIKCMPRVLFTQNVESLLLKRWMFQVRSPFQRVPAALDWLKMRVYETLALRRQQLVAAVSKKDRDELERVSNRSILVLRSGGDLDRFASALVPHKEPTLCFVGTLQWFPNEDAARFFISEIWPLVQKQLPETRCVLVGGRPTDELKTIVADTPNVELTGYVQDVRPYLSEAWVYIVPLRVGSGTRIKILEAMACGVPIVSTRLGAEGLPVDDGKHLLLADDPVQFASAVVRLLRDDELRARLSTQARKLVENELSWAQIRPELRRMLCALLPSVPRTRMIGLEVTE